uniref:Uncharacterized protein n=1 Tax=Globodera rostochiensis TaxID=31243 RepID=A0A914H7W4_GLORO
MFQPEMKPMPLAIMAIALGLSRALLPFLYLRQNAIEHLHWFPMVCHLAHYGSAIVGAVLFPQMTSIRWRRLSPAFLSALAKTICLLFLAIFQYFFELPFPVPFLLVVPLFVVGVADGVQLRVLLVDVLSVQRDASVAQQRYNLFTLLLLTSIGPFLASLIIETNSFTTNLTRRCFGICPLAIHFGIPIPALFVMFAILQALLLPPLWPSESGEMPPDDVHDNEAIQYLASLSKCPPIWRLLLPLCALCALSSALLNNFGTVFFIVPNNLHEFPQERLNFIVFSASAVFLRLVLALSQCSTSIPSTFAHLLHTNALFSVALFGSGLAFCTLNVQAMRTMAVALFGASLALFWPTVLAQWCDFHDFLIVENASNSQKYASSTILVLLISVELGSLLFPLLFTQLLGVYGSARLFSTVALFLIIAMVVAFVYLLNVQAEYKTAKRGDLWGFWRGGRTRRSIRRLMRSVRTSLRKTPRRRHRERLRPRTGTDSALLDESTAGISRSNYQSVQQGLSEEVQRRPRTNTAHDIIVIANDDDRKKKGIYEHKKRQVSLPHIVLDVRTPISEHGKSGHEEEEQ